MVYRIYVEKKEPYAVRAKELKQEIQDYLAIRGLESVRVLIRYDVEALSEDTYKKSLVTVFSEPPVDTVSEGAFDKTVKAIFQMVKLASSNGLPTFLMGHSMGSFMVQAYLEKYPCSTNGIILCGSNGGQAGLMKTGYILARSIVRDHNWYQSNPTLQNMGMGSFSKAVKDRETEFDWLSYNRDNVKAYIEDPWCGHENTGGFWKEFLKGLSKIWDKDEMSKISRREKIYIISGQDDPVGRMGKGPVWLWRKYRSLGLTGATLKLYPNMRHEILNETGKESVYKDILSFVQPGYR